MTQIGTESNPLRIALIGAGPAAFYAADYLLKQEEPVVGIDMFDKLPTPFGLVRGGVAPDHQKIKSVARLFDRIADHPRFRFFGNVQLGEHLSVQDLRRHYHQILYATGAQTDRSLGIPGEELLGSHSATEFVAWYNGHPDYRHVSFDLTSERVVVIGVGNVAVDVCRILCRTPDELATTDIADHALEALRESQVRDVYMIGRRGPAQAAFTNPEVKELGELAGADLFLHPEETTPDPLSREWLDAHPDRETERKLEILSDLASQPPSGRKRRLHLRFLVSPVEILGDAQGRVRAIRLVRNELYRDDAGRLRPRPTGTVEELPVELVFRSVGYEGVPLPGVPFDAARSVILNDCGRVLDPEDGEPRVGEYTGGWIKRGPSGVIGTNKACSVETAECMLADWREGRTLRPDEPEAAAAERLVRGRQPLVFTYEDWRRIDEIEKKRGRESGRPRVKFTDVEEMLQALGRVVA